MYLRLKGKEHRNNSIISIKEIETADHNGALQCITDSNDCCKSDQVGEWIFPDGSTVPIRGSGNKNVIFRNRNDEGSVNLNRCDDEVVTPVGKYCCNVSDASDLFQTICANTG